MSSCKDRKKETAARAGLIGVISGQDINRTGYGIRALFQQQHKAGFFSIKQLAVRVSELQVDRNLMLYLPRQIPLFSLNQLERQVSTAGSRGTL
jgi:hypothetical protein